jgi:hypothetical protein
MRGLWIFSVKKSSEQPACRAGYTLWNNAVGMADMKYLELKNREWLSNHAAMKKISVIARDRF